MNLWQTFRIVNLFGKQHASKLCSGNYASVKLPLPLRNKHTPETQSQSVRVNRIRAVSSAGATKSRLFSSDSRDTTLDDERRKFRDDPEIKAWMNQIAQDFENPPFQVDKTPTKDSRVTLDKASSLEDSPDVQVEDFGYIEDDEDDFLDPVPEKILPVSLERGRAGVFDVEELVAVLKEENGVDIQVMDIPPEARFVEHMVVVSGKSLRHMRAMAASIEWLYKRKKKSSDRQFRLEGRECRDWLAMDLGNIAVHIFTPEARQHYDLETLWMLGPEHDDPRHYVHDDGLNLSEADLFWLESATSQKATSPQTAEDSKTLNSDRTEGNTDHSSGQNDKS